MRSNSVTVLGAFAALCVVAGMAVSVAAVPPLRSAALTALGDERRNDVVALTSALTERKIETADMVPIAHVGVNPLGVNTFLEQEAEVEKRRESLRMIRDAGFGWIRQQFPWEDIEPARGHFWDDKYEHSSWDKYDNIVDLAAQYGLQLIVRLDLPPKWTHPGNLWPHTPPDNFDDYGDFVYAVVSRYEGKVKYYQLWNEPNLAIEWGSKPVDAREYVRLLQVGYRRAKEADPDAVILSAGLAPTIEESWQALNELKYLQQMYDAGARDYFDIMSVMDYGLRSGPDDHRLDLQDVNFSRPLLTREIMVRNGDAGKPIWASEMGWNAQPQGVTAPPTFGRVSEELQARYTVRGLQRAAEEWPWMGVMNLWFFKRVDGHERDQPFYYFRLVEPDFTPHPVYEAVKTLGNSPPVVQRGFSQEDNRAITYIGGWDNVQDPTASIGRMAVTNQSGSSLSFLFKGTEVSLVSPRGPSLDGAHVEIDGSPNLANHLPKVNDKAELRLTSIELESQHRRILASGLSNEVHRLDLVTAGPFAVDGIIVDVQEEPLPIRLLPALGAATAALAAGIALAEVRRRRHRL